LDWVPEKICRTLPAGGYRRSTSLIEGLDCQCWGVASSTTVLVANNSSLGEVVDGAGLLVDPYNVDQIANTLLSALTNQQVCQQLAQSGLQRAKDFNWNDIANKILQIYEEASP
jgi:glycosyltransferase involved in cell wall biosynthesis